MADPVGKTIFFKDDKGVGRWRRVIKRTKSLGAGVTLIRDKDGTRIRTGRGGRFSSHEVSKDPNIDVKVRITKKQISLRNITEEKRILAVFQKKQKTVLDAQRKRDIAAQNFQLLVLEKQGFLLQSPSESGHQQLMKQRQQSFQKPEIILQDVKSLRFQQAWNKLSTLLEKNSDSISLRSGQVVGKPQIIAEWRKSFNVPKTISVPMQKNTPQGRQFKKTHFYVVDGTPYQVRNNRELSYYKHIRGVLNRDRKLEGSFQDKLKRLNLIIKDNDTIFKKALRGAGQFGLNIDFLTGSVLNAIDKAVLAGRGKFFAPNTDLKSAATLELARTKRETPGVIKESLRPDKPENWAADIALLIGFVGAVKSIRPQVKASLKSFGRLKKVWKARPLKELKRTERQVKILSNELAKRKPRIAALSKARSNIARLESKFLKISKTIKKANLKISKRKAHLKAKKTGRILEKKKKQTIKSQRARLRRDKALKVIQEKTGISKLKRKSTAIKRRAAKKIRGEIGKIKKTRAKISEKKRIRQRIRKGKAAKKIRTAKLKLSKPIIELITKGKSNKLAVELNKILKKISKIKNRIERRKQLTLEKRRTAEYRKLLTKRIKQRQLIKKIDLIFSKFLAKINKMLKDRRLRTPGTKPQKTISRSRIRRASTKTLRKRQRKQFIREEKRRSTKRAGQDKQRRAAASRSLAKERLALRRQQKIEQKLAKGLQIKADIKPAGLKDGKPIFPFKTASGKIINLKSRKAWLKAVRQKAKQTTTRQPVPSVLKNLDPRADMIVLLRVLAKSRAGQARGRVIVRKPKGKGIVPGRTVTGAVQVSSGNQKLLLITKQKTTTKIKLLTKQLRKAKTRQQIKLIQDQAGKQFTKLKPAVTLSEALGLKNLSRVLAGQMRAFAIIHKQATRTKQKTKTIQVQKTRQATRTKQAQRLKQIQKQRQAQKLKQAQALKQRQVIRQTRIQRQRQVLTVRQRQILRTLQKTIIQKIRRVAPPFKIKARVSSKNLKELEQWIARQSAVYRPSLAAVLFNITSHKVPKRITGFEIRPLIIRKRRSKIKTRRKKR